MINSNYKIEIVKDPIKWDAYLVLTIRTGDARHYLSKSGEYKSIDKSKEMNFKDLIQIPTDALQDLSNALHDLGYTPDPIKVNGDILTTKNEHIKDLQGMVDKMWAARVGSDRLLDFVDRLTKIKEKDNEKTK